MLIKGLFPVYIFVLATDNIRWSYCARVTTYEHCYNLHTITIERVSSAVWCLVYIVMGVSMWKKTAYKLKLVCILVITMKCTWTTIILKYICWKAVSFEVYIYLHNRDIPRYICGDIYGLYIDINPLSCLHVWYRHHCLFAVVIYYLDLSKCSGGRIAMLFFSTWHKNGQVLLTTHVWLWHFRQLWGNDDDVLYVRKNSMQ